MNPKEILTAKLRRHLPRILLAMLPASLLGSYIARFTTSQIDNVLTKLVVGTFVGLLVGLSVGFLVKRIMDGILYRLKVNTYIEECPYQNDGRIASKATK